MKFLLAAAFWCFLLFFGYLFFASPGDTEPVTLPYETRESSIHIIAWTEVDAQMLLICAPSEHARMFRDVEISVDGYVYPARLHLNANRVVSLPLNRFVKGTSRYDPRSMAPEWVRARFHGDKVTDFFPRADFAEARRLSIIHGVYNPRGW